MSIFSKIGNVVGGVAGGVAGGFAEGASTKNDYEFEAGQIDDATMRRQRAATIASQRAQARQSDATRKAAQAMQARQAVQAGPAAQAGLADVGQTNVDREGMAAQALAARMTGETPSLAEMQMRESAAANRAALASQMASGRGRANPAAARAAMDAMAQQGVADARSAAMLRAQEQATATGQLAQLAASGRAQDINTAQLAQAGTQFDVSQQNQATQADAARAAALQAQQMNLGLQYQGLQQQQAQASGQLALGGFNRELAMQQYNQQQEWQRQLAQAGIYGQNVAQQNQLIGGLLQAGGSAAAMAFSDERVKDNVTSAKRDIGEFLNSVKAHKYNYKWDDKDSPSYSVMAQQLEKTPVGKSMVADGPGGFKVVDYGKGFGALLAAQATLNERLKRLEKGKK